MSTTISKFTLALVLFLFTAVSLNAGTINAYYSAPYADAKTVKSNLGKAGFKVLTSYSPAKKDYLKVIVFTNSKLKSIASKKSRGFAAVQRVLVNSKTKTVLATNPQYWLKAFMQKDFQPGSCKSITASIGKALGKLTPTKDALEGGKLSHFHFMMSMPYYEDMIELKNGAKSVKNKLFEVKLANGSRLVGVKMSKGAESFISTIGEDKALVLPYTVLLEGGKAYALHAKYYLAISYPQLTMGEFMKISSIPDKIERTLKKSIKK